MRRIVDLTYLHKRDHVWWYNRRVRKQFAHLDTCGRIRQSLNTTSLEEARVKRDLLCDADECYWAVLAGVSASGEAANDDQVAAAEQRYKSAASRALAVGFSYKRSNKIVSRHIHHVVDHHRVFPHADFWYAAQKGSWRVITFESPGSER